jgi:hypothetical protein
LLIWKSKKNIVSIKIDIIFAGPMSNEKRNTKGYWALCIVSGIALTLFTIFLPQAFWLGLPTFFGGMAMAMDWV